VQRCGKLDEEVLEKLKLEPPSDPAVLLLGIHSSELKSGSQRDIGILQHLQLYSHMQSRLGNSLNVQLGMKRFLEIVV
jgi:hypothetical protein